MVQNPLKYVGFNKHSTKISIELKLKRRIAIYERTRFSKQDEINESKWGIRSKGEVIQYVAEISFYPTSSYWCGYVSGCNKGM